MHVCFATIYLNRGCGERGGQPHKHEATNPSPLFFLDSQRNIGHFFDASTRSDPERYVTRHDNAPDDSDRPMVFVEYSASDQVPKISLLLKLPAVLSGPWRRHVKDCVYRCCIKGWEFK